MALISIFILALVQALTEFLPVSSTGHLIITQEIGGIDSSLAIDVMLHVGTLLALIVYYRRQLARIIRSFIKKDDNRLLINLLISSLPAAVAGYLLADVIEGGARNIILVAVMLMAVGLIMFFEDRLLPQKASKQYQDLSHAQALGIGIAQSVALIPGTSRSGISMIAGRMMKMNNKQAADYAFLIGIPIIAGAGLKVLTDSAAQDFLASYPFDAAFGVAVAAIFGYLAIDFVLQVVKKAGLKWFGAYRIALALVLLMLI